MRWIAILLAAAALPAATACHRDERPNVVLVTLDTTRADALGAMGHAGARTPALDALAARGALFERAYASTPLTLPSHATILTGTDPRVHGVRDNGDLAAWEDLETLAERLAARGYGTAAFVAAFVLDASFGLDRGFDLYDDEIERRGDPLSFAVPQRRGEVVTDRALAWLGERRRGPFFLWAHYYDPHTPREPPPPFDQLEDPYDGEVAYLDAQVARLLEGAERAAGGRETLIVVVGDHGESLGEHGEATHGVVVYDSTLHVPLIAAGPGFAAGARSRAFVGTRDVAATILTAAGEPPFPRSQGVPLQRVLAGEGPAERTDYFASLGPWYRFGWARLAGVRDSRWKYTAEPEPVELYDVLADPGETVNRAGEEPEVVARLEALYRELWAEERAVERAQRSVSPEVEDKLAALGYVTAPEQFEPGEEPDPREFVGGVGLVDLARGLAVQGRVAASIEALEILGMSPIVRVLALRSLATVYLAAGRPADAVTAFRELVAKAPAREFSLGLARALLRDGRPAECLELFERLPAEMSGRRGVQLLRGDALLDLGRAGEALEVATALLSREPGDDAALALASEARVAREPEGGAAPEIERLKALLASSAGVRPLPRTRALLAGLLRAQRRDAEAVRVLEAAAVTTNAHRGLPGADRGGPREPPQGGGAVPGDAGRAALAARTSPGAGGPLRPDGKDGRGTGALRHTGCRRSGQCRAARGPRGDAPQGGPAREGRGRPAGGRGARRQPPRREAQSGPDRAADGARGGGRARPAARRRAEAGLRQGPLPPRVPLQPLGRPAGREARGAGRGGRLGPGAHLPAVRRDIAGCRE
jgi:arylsulfatase A-like enzyme